MKFPTHIALCFCLLLARMQLSAQNFVSPFPTPPMQSQPWTLSSTNLPPGLQSVVKILFQSGMADPRGCDYREIEVVIGNVSKVSGITNKIHGWLLPSASSARTNYAIGWNGLIYQVVSVGNPASAGDDARALIRAMSPPAIPNKVIFDAGVQTYIDEDYSLNVRWLTPAKAAMIFRFAPPELAEECVQLFPNKDPFLTLSTSFLWTTFDRAICAHMRGDDDLAYFTALTLTQDQKICEAEAKVRGIPVQQSSRQNGGTPTNESRFPFLNNLPALLQDQERRHQRKTALRDPSTITNKTERIAALIDQLENVTARQVALYAVDYNLTENPKVQALINEGWDAIGPLLQCYEHDDRLTRMIPVSMFGGGGFGGGGYDRNARPITSVRSVAYAALEGIIETPQFAPSFSGKETPEEKDAIYKASALAIRGYWEKYRGMSRAERLYQILNDDHGQWLEAATLIVQSTNQTMFVESLRSKSNPSVSDLLIRRAESLAARSRSKTESGGTVDDASELNEACDLAFCLAKWDPKAALKTMQMLSDLSFQKLSPEHYSSLSSHMALAGQLPELIKFRANAGDTKALRDYAAWLQSIDPGHFSWEVDTMLEPLKQFPNDSAWVETWEFLFDDEQSAWFNYLGQQSKLDPTRMSSPLFNVDEYFSTPFINKIPFRKFVIRLLHDKSACGKIVGEAAHGYWLDQQLSIMRRYGYTVESPKDGSEINGKEFRICDFYAWLLSNRIEGAPAFQLYWPESKRDEAIAAIEKFSDSNSSLKTQPFQER